MMTWTSDPSSWSEVVADRDAKRDAWAFAHYAATSWEQLDSPALDEMLTALAW